DKQKQMPAVDWLLKELVCAVFHRLDGFINCSVCGEHYHRSVCIGGLRGAQDFEPVCARHFHISENKVVTTVIETSPRLGAIASFIDRVASILKRKPQHLPEAVFVFYE